MYKKFSWLFIGLLLLLAGASVGLAQDEAEEFNGSYGQEVQSIPQGGDILTTELLLDHVWQFDCANGNPARQYLRFLPDGTVKYGYKEPYKYTYHNAVWKIEGGYLYVDFNKGYAVDRYPIQMQNGVLVGRPAHTRSCGKVYLKPYGVEGARNPYQRRSSGHVLTAEMLMSKVWRYDCAKGNPAVRYMKFLPDGTVKYDYDNPYTYKYHSAVWRIENGYLIMDFNKGYAIDRYPIEFHDGVLIGEPAHTRSCKKVYMRPYRD